MKMNRMVLAVVALTACGKKSSDANTGSMTMKVKSVSVSALTATSDRERLNMTMAAAGNLSFTPTVLKIWIDMLVLQNGGGGSNEFYTCTSSAPDCEVDFASADSVKV